MEKSSYVVNGGIKMPIGYRFHPTDEELVVHYLKRKALVLPLPASVIPEFDVFQTDPSSLPGDLNENRYFFSNRRSEDKRTRVAGCGYWKPVGKEREILASGSNQLVGMRRTLVFSEGKKRSHETKTQWLMHQYRLTATTQMSEMEQLGDWFVYKVFQRKRKHKKNGVVSKPDILQVTKPSCIDFTVEDWSEFGPPPQPLSPNCSSEITEVSFNGLDQEESSSAFFSFHSNSCMGKY